MSKNSTVFYGEINCSNKAYSSCGKIYLCGVHSRKFTAKQRLNKRSKQDSLRLKNEILTEQKKEIEQARLENKSRKAAGQVTYSKQN